MSPTADGDVSKQSPATSATMSPNNPTRVLVIDDDPTMRRLIVSYFEDHACLAAPANGTEDIATLLAGAPLSLIVLDAQLGRRDGFDVLREIRERSDVPVIIITGARPDEIDRIVGLELGADDYLTKPFNLRELMARARAVLRRQEMGRAHPANVRTGGGYRFRGWELRRKTHTLFDPSGEQVILTKSEYALLVAFLEAPRRPLSREQLLQKTRTHDDIYDRSIDVQVLRLRRKLEVDPAQPEMVKTERGFGYFFDATVDPLF